MNDNYSGEFLAAIQGGLLTILTKFDFGFFGHHLQHTISIIIQALIGVLTVKIYKLYFEQRTMDFIKKYMIKFFNIHPNEKENDKK